MWLWFNRNLHIRLLGSLEDFLDKIEVEQDDNKTANVTQTVFTFETFALQVQQFDPGEYKGQIFSVNLGSLEEARKVNQTIGQGALVTSELEPITQFSVKPELDNNAIAGTTALLRLPRDLLDSCSDTDSYFSLVTSQRLSYSVFKSDVLFQNPNQSHLSIGSIIVAARLKCGDNNMTLNSSIKSVFQIDEVVRINYI